MMSTHATDPHSAPARDSDIELSIDTVSLTPEGGPAIDFRITAKANVAHVGGYLLWSEDESGRFFRHSSTKDAAEMHRRPFGTFLWWAQAIRHTKTTMRFFAAWERENPVRVSNYVDVVLPTEAAPVEFAARDGGLKVICTGRVRPRGSVVVQVAGASSRVDAQKDGTWRAIIDAAPGTYTAIAVSRGIDLPDSPPVSAQVVVAQAPAIPLLLLFPEEGRKISRLTRVTGTARPGTRVEVSLGGGPVVTAEAGPGGAWEAREARSDQSGSVLLFVETPDTGEALHRAVDVEYFPEWDVAHLIAGPIFDDDGLVTRAGAIAEGRGEHGDVIQFSQSGGEPWTDLATVAEDLRWRFEHLAPPPPPPPLRPGMLHLRSAGDPLTRRYSVEQQAPLITAPAEGSVTGTHVEFSGFAVRPFDIQLPDGSTQRVTPDKEHVWKMVIGPFAAGVHTVIARASARQREQTRRTFLVEEGRNADTA